MTKNHKALITVLFPIQALAVLGCSWMVILCTYGAFRFNAPALLFNALLCALAGAMNLFFALGNAKKLGWIK